MEKAKHVHSADLYSSFMFIRLSLKFRHLMSNERITAKQEFENIIASCQEKLFLRTYSLTGIRADCDILFWRISPDADVLQQISTRMFSTGIGKFFIPVHSFLGIFQLPETAARREMECGFLPKGFLGGCRFLHLHPLVRSHSWYELSESERQKLMAERAPVLSRHPNVQEHFFNSFGLDDQELIVVRESDRLDDLAKAAKELREQRIKAFTQRDTPSLLCFGRDLRDILDAMG